MNISANDTPGVTERGFALSILIEPLLEPLQTAFGDYAGIAQQEFASALGRMLQRSNG